ncbi:tetratricopeptide repeat-containing sulfotransferase family protein [Dyella japonica]
MTPGTTLPGNTSALLAALAAQPESEWLAQGRALTLRSDMAGALAVFNAATSRFPESADIRLGLAGLLWQTGESEQAEQLLREWLAAHPADASMALLLASLLREHGRLTAVGEVLLSAFANGAHDVDTVIRAVETLDDYGRPNEALTICENAMAADDDDPRLHAYAGMLGIQLGQFERTRAHYARALQQEPAAVEWNIPLGLAGLQRYEDASHPDFSFFRDVLARSDITAYTRRSTLFALGKAHDDVGDYASAATYFRQANAMGHAHASWSRKLWKRNIQARLAAAKPTVSLPAPTDWTPIFVVGVPRSGTTLVAKRLADHAGVRNRGELGWLQVWEERLSHKSPLHAAALEEAARSLEMQLRQDDGDASWIIDKQPLNLLRVDLIMALWPNARIVHCQRNARDTALSLWTQPFHDQAHDYAYDFGDIDAVIRGCRQLAELWQARYPQAFRSIAYEQLVCEPDACIDALRDWLGMPLQSTAQPTDVQSVIATASAWQARQPVYTRSAGRWVHYAPYLPELLDIPGH